VGANGGLTLRAAIGTTIVGTAIAGALLATQAWVVSLYRVNGPSMEPTLHCATPVYGCRGKSADRVFASRFAFRFREPERGEIVAFEAPPEALARCGAQGIFIKRIVGVPGDRVSLRDGDLWTRVPPGHYFLMGDNRLQSCDSRDWGPVAREKLAGPVFAVFPPSK